MTPGLHASAQTSVLTPHNPPPNITPPSTNTHKRPATSVPTPQPASKRARPGYSENTPPSPGPGIAPTLSPPPVLSVPGAGPITSPPASMKANNTAQIPASGRSSAAATDVWYFVVPVKSKEPADVLSARQANLHPLASRPESDYIACRLCSNKSIAVWKCAEGQTKTILKGVGGHCEVSRRKYDANRGEARTIYT
ncbi:hypothetical protein BDN72DRAFT_612075 [Pluteus cervinus]|uniref:Uncharacterized protein n=1 Tax=Pluteus cervinus TaxID=181527 RepID=A0ACD3AUZ8_9AGAR|nr:hypothetical protein BDN72DRAFT_612075 [Pluteus cervinus]